MVFPCYGLLSQCYAIQKKWYGILSYGMTICNAKRFEERVQIIVFRRGLMFPRTPYSSPIYWTCSYFWPEQRVYRSGIIFLWGVIYTNIGALKGNEGTVIFCHQIFTLRIPFCGTREWNSSGFLTTANLDQRMKQAPRTPCGSLEVSVESLPLGPDSLPELSILGAF